MPLSAINAPSKLSEANKREDNSTKVDATAPLAIQTPPISPMKYDAIDVAQSPPAIKKSQSPSPGLAALLPSLAIPTPVPTQASRFATKLIRVSESCPQAMRRTVWNVDDFDIRGAPLYTGRISAVYHAVDRRSGITIALKVYKRSKLSDIERVQVSREISLHCSLVHESVIAMYAAWKDDDLVYMALEWAAGGDVYHYMRKTHGGRGMPEELAVPLILQPFLSGLANLHGKGLIHRDIKPENILITSAFQIKIADFGLSIDSKREIANTRLGTIDYLSPEILECPVKTSPFENKDNPNGGYTSKVDCWSSGVLAYELLTGYAPFAAKTPYETLQNIKHQPVVYPPHLSAGAVAFMNRILVKDPSQRPTVAEILRDPWLVSLGKPSKAKGPPTRCFTVGNLGDLSQAANLAQAPSAPLDKIDMVVSSERSAMSKKRGSPVEFDESPPAPVASMVASCKAQIQHPESPSAPKKARGEAPSLTQQVTSVLTIDPVSRKGLVSTMLSKLKAGIMRPSSNAPRPASSDHSVCKVALPSIVPVTKRFAALAVASGRNDPAPSVAPAGGDYSTAAATASDNHKCF